MRQPSYARARFPTRQDTHMKRSLPYETYVAMKRLKHEDIWYERVSPYHLKVDAYNFYPKRGIIHVDGEPDAFPQRGLEVFVKLVKTDACAQLVALCPNCILERVAMRLSRTARVLA